MTASIVLLGLSVLVTAILTTAKKEIVSLVNKEMQNLADHKALEIKNWLDEYMVIARTMSSFFAESIRTMPAEDRRASFDLLLQSVLKAHPEIDAVASAWEPNAVDGNDALYANTAGSDATGRFLSNWVRTDKGISVTPLLNYEKPGAGDYYLNARQTGKETIINPYMYSIGGEETLIATLTAPVIVDGRFRGIALIDVRVADIQSKIESLNLYKNSVAIVFSNNGIVSGHTSSERIGKPLGETEVELSSANRNNLLAAVKNGTRMTFSNKPQGSREKYFFTITPIPIGASTTPWSLMIGIPSSVMNEPVLRMLKISIPRAVSILALIFAAAFFMARSISSPLTAMKETLTFVGDGNLTRELAIKSKDEIGDISRSFNQMLEKMKRLIGVIKQQTINLMEIGNELSSSMIETSSAANQITANIQSIKNRVINQAASITQTNATMEQITLNINHLDENISEQSANVSQSSSAIEQMLTNIQSVTQTLVKNTRNVTELSQSAEKGKTGLIEVARDIKEIARESAGLLEINSVMENIASQTNLLSMNASIEAAHAGETGKGFAVVADEIRKLSESSSEQSKTIGAVLKKIKESIDKITVSTDNVLGKFALIDSGVKVVADQEGHIRNAMEEQGEGSKQILDAISKLNGITHEVKNGSNEMLQGSKEVIHEAKNLENVSIAIEGGMNEMVTGIAQINTAIEHLNAVSKQNKENIDVLLQEVSRFTVN
jgi:methyl-accepting chemotaxis protein